MGQQPMPDLSLGFGDDLVRLRKLLQVINSCNEWILVNHCGADPEHVQDHLRVLRIILIPPVVQGLSGPRQRILEIRRTLKPAAIKRCAKTRW